MIFKKGGIGINQVVILILILAMLLFFFFYAFNLKGHMSEGFMRIFSFGR